MSSSSRAMGYNDLLTFLMAIPDTVRVNRLQSGIVVVQGVYLLLLSASKVLLYVLNFYLH